MRASNIIFRVAGLILSLGASAAQAGAIHFTPVTVPAHQYTGGWEFFVGGGVAVLDCNHDLLPDLYVAGGAGPAMLLQNVTAGRGKRLNFKAVTPPLLALKNVIGAYPVDIDSDGWLDLVVLGLGKNILLRGGPDCSFSPFPETLGFTSADHWTTAFSATWEQHQTLPTLAFGNYVDRTNPKGPFRACDKNFLYQPKGKRYTPPLALTPGYCALSMLFTDWARRGRADLRVSNDRHYYVDNGAEQMWAMSKPPHLYTAKEGWRTYQLWGMGIASRDITGDGWPDVFLSSMGDQKLQIFDPGTGGPSYKDAPYARGTTAQRPYTGGDGRPSTGWQIAFGDVQNDGLDDVFISKGNVQEMPELAMRDPNNLLVQRADGTFEEQGLQAGLADMARGRGAALVDLNLDGRLDVVVVNRMAPLRVYQNETPDTGHWLLLYLHQPAPNPRAVGAWVEVRAAGKSWTREITVGGGHASGTASLIHFGLGKAKTGEIRVIWPDQTTTGWTKVNADQILGVNRAGRTLTLRPL